MKKSSTPLKLMDRRHFLKSSAGVALFIGTTGLLPQLVSCRDEKKVREVISSQRLTAWVQLEESGKVTIYNPAAEMGQGSMTSLPAIFAEEMDADWNNVEVLFSPQVSEIYGSYGWTPDQKVMLSAGSRVTNGYYDQLRMAGAQARRILLHSVATHWGVPLGSLQTQAGRVEEVSGGRSIFYGEILPFIQMPEDLEQVSVSDLKDPSTFRLIGKVIPRVDVPSKVDGSAQFAMDIRLPGMLYGVCERGKVHGAKPELNNENEILALDGVKQVVMMDHAVGLVAESLEKALAAKAKLDISWSSESDTASFNSQELYTKYAAIASGDASGKPVVEKGDVPGAFAKAHKLYTVDFKNDYTYHAQMEPLNAVVRISEGEESAEVWVGTQQGFDSKLGVPQLLGIAPEKVTIHMQYLGGGFGRRSMTDFVHEAVHLARAVKPLPVKLIWTREDDLTYGAFRPLSLQRLQASTDRSGKITGFSHILVGDGDGLLASGIRNDYYAIENQYAELRIVPHHIRLKHWRAVGHGPNKFAIECMIDEVAHDQGRDPVAFRRELMRNAPRALATLEKAAEMARWGEPVRQGRGRGVAFLERSGTLSTGICEISVDKDTGKIRVHHFWTASDAGVVVQPDNAVAQMEGGLIMGMSSVLQEQITVTAGAVDQTNFNDYPLLKMEDMPESIETAFIASDQTPQGVGESGTPLAGCCIANAFLALTGKKLRHMPFTPERVLEALQNG